LDLEDLDTEQERMADTNRARNGEITFDVLVTGIFYLDSQGGCSAHYPSSVAVSYGYYRQTTALV
jgi:hypothetical protein